MLPLDIIELIIDIIAENKDTDLLKKLALVSRFFLPLCRKHIFATIKLSRKKPICLRFIELLTNPDIAKYIRNLTYTLSYLPPSPILPYFLQTISQLEYLTIVTTGLQWDWNSQDSSAKSALLFLIHLPTIKHIKLVSIINFPLSALTPCLNLNWLDISSVIFTMPSEGLENIHSEVPRIHRFSSAPESTLAMQDLLHAKLRDGRPAFNFKVLKHFSVFFSDKNKQNTRDLLQNIECLEVLRMEVVHGQSIVGFHDMISPTARTLRSLYLNLPYGEHLPLSPALCEELEAMTGHNILETLEFQVNLIGSEPEDDIGIMIQKLEEVLLKPGWSSLKQVSFELPIACCSAPSKDIKQLENALQSLPEKYLSRLSELESMTFNYSAYVAKCVHCRALSMLTNIPLLHHG